MSRQGRAGRKEIGTLWPGVLPLFLSLVYSLTSSRETQGTGSGTFGERGSRSVTVPARLKTSTLWPALHCQVPPWWFPALVASTRDKASCQAIPTHHRLWCLVIPREPCSLIVPGSNLHQTHLKSLRFFLVPCGAQFHFWNSTFGDVTQHSPRSLVRGSGLEHLPPPHLLPKSEGLSASTSFQLNWAGANFIIISQQKLLQQTSRDALEGEKGEKRKLHSEETTSLRKSPNCKTPWALPSTLQKSKGS